jgi:hypothetical protein
MAVEPPPIQEKTADQSGLFPQTWIKWFLLVCDAITINNFAVIEIITGDITLGKADSTILCDASGGVLTVTLPDVSEFNGFKFNIKKIDVSANDVTIDGDGADIDASATRLLSGSGYPSITIHSDGSDWWIL